MDTKGERKTAVAGQFYPANAESLREQVRTYADRQPRHPGRKTLALIAPHAGYQYSGPIAGAAFAEIRDSVEQYSRVVVLAPSHRTPFRGLSCGEYTSYETPLGSLEVDSDLCGRLAESSRWISRRTDAHEGEHALEVELPFIAELLPKARLIPLICGDMDAEVMAELAAVLAAQLDISDTLWIVSSDFTHFGRAFGYLPFQDDVAHRLEELDRGAIDWICRLDPDQFLEYVDQTGATICGRMPIALLLQLIQKVAPGASCELLEYSNIGKMTGDYQHSVSYASLAFYAPDDEDSESQKNGEDGQEAPPDRMSLSQEERTLLLHLARQSIEARLREERLDVDRESLPGELKEKRACFVTLNQNGRLRGCIGSLQATEPLFENVIHNARNAAFQDPRFPGLDKQDLPEIDIEISVLTPARPIRGIKDFEVGRHGIILEKGPSRSVFLPQVAPEQGWDRETTLKYLSLKAGLPENGWRHGATLKVFEAIVFREEKD